MLPTSLYILSMVSVPRLKEENGFSPATKIVPSREPNRCRHLNVQSIVSMLVYHRAVTPAVN
jgi:hypothetical protein